MRHALPQGGGTKQINGTIADALLQTEKAIEHAQCNQMAGHAAWREILLTQKSQVTPQFADTWLQIVADAPTSDPLQVACQITRVGQERIGRQAAFALDVIAK